VGITTSGHTNRIIAIDRVIDGQPVELILGLMPHMHVRSLGVKIQ